MRSYISKLVISVALLLNCLSCIAQEESSDAVYLSLIKEYSLHPDGSMDYHQYKELKLLTYNAFHRLYGETFIVYNPAFQKLKINDAFTVMADGKKVVTPENALNEVLPGFAANAPAYNHLREMVVTHTGLERGAVIHLDYTISSSKELLPYLMGNEVLTTSSPINSFTIIIRVPKNTTLKYKAFNVDAAPVITEKDQIKIYTWVLNGLPAQTSDPRQPENQENQPRIIFSTAPSMKNAIDYLVNQDAFRYKPDDTMEEIVSKIVAEKKGELETILKLQDIVVNDVNTYNIPLVYLGFRARSATDTWNSNGGTELEKVILLRSLLLKAGINSYPIAVIPSAFYDQETGCLPQIIHFIVQVNPREEGQLYLSTTQSDERNLVYDLTEETMILTDPGFKDLRILTSNERQNKVVTDWQIIIDRDNSLLGGLKLELFGACNPYLTLIRDKSSITQLLSPDFTEKEIHVPDSMNISALKSQFTCSFEKTNPLKSEANYFFWNLPFINKGVKSWNYNYLNENRNGPFEIPYTIEEHHHYKLNIPIGWTLIAQDTLLILKNTAGEVDLSIRKSGNEIDISRSILLPSKTFNSTQYKDLRLLINAWNNKNFSRFIFKD